MTNGTGVIDVSVSSGDQAVDVGATLTPLTPLSMRGSGYAGGKLGRDNRDWNPPFGPSADAELFEDFPLLTARSRYLCRNNELIGAAADRTVDRMYGSSIETWAFSLDDDGNPIEEWNKAVDDLLLRVMESKHVDHCHRQMFHELMRTNLHETIETGNGFLVESADASRNRDFGIPFSLESIEVEQLDASEDRDPEPGRNGIFNGIEYDGDNRPVKLHFLNQYGDREFRWAADVNHMHRVRRRQVMGVSWYARVIRRLWSFYRYLDAEIGRAANASRFVAMVKREHAQNHFGQGFVDTDNAELQDIWGNPLIGMAANILLQGGPQDSFATIDGAPPGDATPWINMFERILATGCGMSYQRFTGDVGSASFSGAKFGETLDWEHYRPLQDWIVRYGLQDIRRRIITQAVGFDLLRIPGKSESASLREFNANRSRWLAFGAVGPGQLEIDEVKAATAAILRIKNGLSNFSIEMARYGKRAKGVWAQLERELAAAERDMPHVHELIKAMWARPGDNMGSDDDTEEKAGSDPKSVTRGKQSAFLYQ